LVLLTNYSEARLKKTTSSSVNSEKVPSSTYYPAAAVCLDGEGTKYFDCDCDTGALNLLGEVDSKQGCKSYCKYSMDCESNAYGSCDCLTVTSSCSTCN